MSNRIGVDMDGILSDFITTYKELIIKVSGMDLFPKREWDSWYFEKEAGYTNQNALNEVWNKIKASETFWETLPHLPGAGDALWQLGGRISKGDDVYFITNRPSTGVQTAKYQTEQWLLNHMDLDFTPTVIVTTTKGPVAKALELTHFIDDKWENCLDIDEPTKVYLMNRPWNQADKSNTVKRVNSVLDMLKELD